jgi:hypothetical protein
MASFKADMHIHTVLSPCGSLEMSPLNIVQSALDAKLDIIAITDHNSTRQVAIVKHVAQKKGLFAIGGAEVNSAEEVHCLALFETDEQLSIFQTFIDKHILKIQNKPDFFGYQVVVDEDENITYEEPWLLINALDAGILEIEKLVHSLDGLFIPAHIDRQFNGIISQLGFIPDELKCDALELSPNTTTEKWKDDKRKSNNNIFIRNSDAHTPRDIARQFTILEMEDISFQSIRKALLSNSLHIH